LTSSLVPGALTVRQAVDQEEGAMPAQENATALDPSVDDSHDLDSFAAEVAADHRGDRPKAGPALPEKDAYRFAVALEDYEHVSVADIGGNDPHDYWLVVRDHHFELCHEIGFPAADIPLLGALGRSLLRSTVSPARPWMLGSPSASVDDG
jgi:hypothetical protein